MPSTPSSLIVHNVTQDRPVCTEGMLANTFSMRLFGLLGKRSLPQQAGLLIRPSSGVHTFWMSMPIDIVALDSRNRVIGLWESVGPWKIRALGLRTKSVLELAPGQIARCGLAVGDDLAMLPRTEAA